MREPTQDIIDRNLRKYVREQRKRDDKEVYAAWRAGYDYLVKVTAYDDRMLPRVEYLPRNTSPMNISGMDGVRCFWDLRDDKLSMKERTALERYEP